MKYSATELFSFLDYAAAKGLTNRHTAMSRKTACTKILENLDEEEKHDLRRLDREQVFERFINLNKKDYTPQSLQVYRSRFNSALDDFLTFADDPTAVRRGKKPDQKGKADAAKEARRQIRTKNPVDEAAAASSPKTMGVHDSMFELPLPLSDGKVARLLLPRTLSKADADRLAAVIAAYAVGH